MPSPHSPARRKSAVRREQVIQLLQDGAVTTDPGEELLSVAADLQQLGLIEASTSTFVWCANPHDADYSESDHYCRGRIYVPDNMEESFEDFYCPECERPVFPDIDEKQRHCELRCTIVPASILGYLKSLLERARLTATSVCEGVMRVHVGPLGVFVCVADTCQESKFLSPVWAATQPTCYVLTNPRSSRGMLVERRRLPHVLLADIICGNVDLATAVHQMAKSPPKGRRRPAFITNPCRESPRRLPDSMRLFTHKRRFEVAVHHDGMWVEGLKVMNSRAAPRLEMLRMLWESYLEDLLSGRRPAEFRAYSLQVIRTWLESRLQKRYPDELTVRRMINRTQVQLSRKIRRELGLPVGREDIIQTCAWKRQETADFGYRLNPARVIIATAPCSTGRKS